MLTAAIRGAVLLELSPRRTRNRCSRNRYDKMAGTSESSAARILIPGTEGNRTGTSTIAGQCQRYQLYDRSPSHTSAGSSSNRLASPIPDAMTSTAPATGRAAAMPGKGVSAENLNAATMMRTRPVAPAQVDTRVDVARVLRAERLHNATSTPARN